MRHEIEYGKAAVSVYRAHPGSDRPLFAALVDVTVLGEEFLASYTEGDNARVVATDSMKNFIHATALEHEGATIESFAAYLGRRFLATYPQMEGLRVAVREIAFARVGDALWSRERDERAFAEIELGRAGGGAVVRSARSGRLDLRLVKLTGSSFERFVRDEFTTLAETVDRPLFVHLDVGWRYADLADATGDRADRYVDPVAVRDAVRATFDELNSRSIQHLVHEMGTRILARWPQLAEVSFEAENRTWDAVLTSGTDGTLKVHTDPRETYGRIGLVLRR